MRIWPRVDWARICTHIPKRVVSPSSAVKESWDLQELCYRRVEESDMPDRPAGETLQLRVARVEDQLWGPVGVSSDFSDDDLLVFVRVRRALYSEFHRFVYQVCRKNPYEPDENQGE